MGTGRTIYSEPIPGAHGNYGWAVRFDKCDGYVGINQYDEDGLKDRILLSPKQIGELLAFVSKKRVNA